VMQIEVGLRERSVNDLIAGMGPVFTRPER
jgi:hypothetical protein